MVDRVAEFIEHSGRRRVQWKPLLRLVPFVLAAVLTALGVWSLIVTKPPLAQVLFVSAVLGIAWIGAFVMHPRIAERYKGWSSGHRFREASRATVRERIANTRATVFVSLITVPVGAVIGFFLRMWLGG